MSTPRIYSPQQANELVPRLSQVIPELRKIRDLILKSKDQYDVEELSSYGVTGAHAAQAREKMEQLKKNVQSYERDFEKKLHFFDDIGCDLKSLDPGLVDFYARKAGDLVYLCWREDEVEVRFWHSLQGGFAGRQPISNDHL